MEDNYEQRLKKNLIVSLSLQLATEIVEYCAALRELKQFEISSQLLRAGTSVGANVWESQHSESNKDFIHKMKIASKECNETAFWLTLCSQSKELPSPGKVSFTQQSVGRVLSKIIASSKQREAQKTSKI